MELRDPKRSGICNRASNLFCRCATADRLKQRLYDSVRVFAEQHLQKPLAIQCGLDSLVAPAFASLESARKLLEGMFENCNQIQG